VNTRPIVASSGKPPQEAVTESFARRKGRHEEAASLQFQATIGDGMGKKRKRRAVSSPFFSKKNSNRKTLFQEKK